MALVCFLLGPLKSWGDVQRALKGNVEGCLLCLFFLLKELGVLADLLAGPSFMLSGALERDVNHLSY